MAANVCKQTEKYVNVLYHTLRFSLLFFLASALTRGRHFSTSFSTSCIALLQFYNFTPHWSLPLSHFLTSSPSLFPARSTFLQLTSSTYLPSYIQLWPPEHNNIFISVKKELICYKKHNFNKGKKGVKNSFFSNDKNKIL